ncbi:MAG: helix-turn-helix domain-containing protein, partial [Dehalococcoidia bacterium]|nr:helix-turn-helix domain-containing protein [Dehalococcoidia bacterium]
GGGGAAGATDRAGRDEHRAAGAAAEAGGDVRGGPAGGHGERPARPVRGGIGAPGDGDRGGRGVAGRGRLAYPLGQGLGGFVTEEGQAQAWLSLGRASRMLGVSHSTVRRWADAGEIRSYRTSGGHRRILEEDVRQFMAQHTQAAGSTDTDRISELAVGRVKRRLSRRRQSREMDMFADLDAASRERLRFIGRQLVDLFARFVSSRTRPDRFIDDARGIGGEYGRTLVAAGVTLTDAVMTFNALRHSLEETAAQLASEAQQGTDEAVEAMESILALADTVLEGMAHVYQESLARA